MTNEELVNALGQLTAPQLVALTKELEAKWGVSGTPQVVQQPTNTQTEVKQEAQTEFTVVLASFAADKKMAVVKMVREQLGLGLLESKNLVESLPKTLKESCSKEEAEALKAKMTEAGGVVELK